MNSRLLHWTIFILLCLIWGSSFILMKAGNEALTATQIAALRIFSAGVVFIPVAVYHLRKIPLAKIRTIFIAGFFGNLLPAFLFALAITKKESSLVGILNSLTPICVVIIGSVFFHARIGRQKITGIIVGFAGLCLLTLSHGDISFDNIGYDSLVIFATISYGLNVNIVSHYLGDITPIQVTSVSLVFMAIPCAIILGYTGFFHLDFTDTTLRWSVLASLLLGIVGSSIATVLFYVLVQQASGLFASLVTYGIPFVAVMWGVIYHEPVTYIDIICLVIILFGVYLANRKINSE